MQETNLGEDAETTNSTNVDAEGDSTAGEDGGDDLFYYPISLEYVVAVAGPTKGLPLPLIRDKQTWLNDAVDVMVQEEIAELQGRRKLFRGRQLQTSTNILYMTSAQVVDWSLLSSSSSCRASSAWTCWKVQQSLSIQQQEVSLTSGRPVDQTGPSFGRTILDWKERDVTSNAQRLEEGLKARILQQLSVQDDKDSVTTTISLEFQDLLRDTVPDDISAVASLLSDGDTISLLNDNATDVDDSNEKMKAWAIVLIVLAILLCLTGLCYGCDRYTASTSLEGPTTTQRLRAGLQKAAQMVTRNPQYDQNTKGMLYSLQFC